MCIRLFPKERNIQVKVKKGPEASCSSKVLAKLHVISKVNEEILDIWNKSLNANFWTEWKI